MHIVNNKTRSSLLEPRLKMIVLVFSFLIFSSSFSKLLAQESMIPELSNNFLSQLIDTAKKYYPLVKINQKRIDISYINFQKSKMAWFDVFSLTLNYSPNGNTTTSLNQPTLSGFQIGLFINFGSILQKPYLIKVAKEEVELAYLNKQEILLTTEAEVKARYIKFVQSSVLLRMQSKIAIEAESVVKDARYKFEKGEANFETFTKALIYESDNRKLVIDAEANLLIAKASLETIVGKKLSEIH
ncbi:MAG: TolC family protein [Bacteroidota bacterium]